MIHTTKMLKVKSEKKNTNKLKYRETKRKTGL